MMNLPYDLRVGLNWMSQLLGDSQADVAKDRHAPTTSSAASLSRDESEEASARRYRYERKFCLDSLPREQVESLLLLHPAMFREIHHERWVNNIYLDSPELIAFHAAMAGDHDRTKVRVRWYGDLFGPMLAAQLEFKRKEGEVGYKELFSLPPLDVHPGFRSNSLSRLVSQSVPLNRIKAQLTALEPTLVNRYRRRYFVSADGRFRATVDSDLEYRPPDHLHNTSLVFREPLAASVLEIKYDSQDDERVQSVLKRFPLRVTKKSKYISGMLAIQ